MPANQSLPAIHFQSARLRRAPLLKPDGRARIVASSVMIMGAVAATAFLNHKLSRRAEERHPAQGEFMEVDGVRLHYHDKGEGDAILLIHGLGASSEDFLISGVFDILAKTHRVIAFDRPGFGYSERPRSKVWTAKAQAELLRRGLHQLGIGRCIVAGHSWGAQVAMTMGLEHPSAVSGLVLMSGYYSPTLRIDVPPQIWPSIPLVGELVRYTVAPLIGRLAASTVIRQLFAPAPVTARFESEFSVAMALRPSQIRANAADMTLMAPDAARTAGRHGDLTMPVLIVTARGDRVVSSKRQSERLAREVPQSHLRHLHIVGSAGHMVHHSSPQEVADTIRTALFARPVPQVA